MITIYFTSTPSAAAKLSGNTVYCLSAPAC